MHDLLTRWFAEPTFRNVYLAVFVVALVGPMVWLTRWYHRNIGGTHGGRRLMHRQMRTGTRDLGGVRMAGDIERGDYGGHARGMQRRVYTIVGTWLFVVTVLLVPLLLYMPSA